jgi:hypothetical protein
LAGVEDLIEAVSSIERCCVFVLCVDDDTRRGDVVTLEQRSVESIEEQSFAQALTAE